VLSEETERDNTDRGVCWWLLGRFGGVDVIRNQPSSEATMWNGLNNFQDPGQVSREVVGMSTYFSNGRGDEDLQPVLHVA